jgi:hypothetical protein
MKTVCLFCHKIFFYNKWQSLGKYCSNKCQQEFQYLERISVWKKTGKINKASRRRYLIDSYGYKCFVCGISDWNSNPITLEVEHKDGNSENNKEENLGLICPNCHSQTSTYKAKNKGNGRHLRRKRYQENKSY